MPVRLQRESKAFLPVGRTQLLQVSYIVRIFRQCVESRSEGNLGSKKSCQAWTTMPVTAALSGKKQEASCLASCRFPFWSRARVCVRPGPNLLQDLSS